MRKKFVQTLAAQQLEMSANIVENDEMESQKKEEPTCPEHTQRDSQPSSSVMETSDSEVIEILDDDNDVELMMERHRKYHPRKYVNLQQPPSKIYYDQIEKPVSPTPDKEYHDVVGEEEDEDHHLVIDCVQTKEVNNNSTTASNENLTMERGSNVEPAGPAPFLAPVEMETATPANSEQQTMEPSVAAAAAPTAASGFNWNMPQHRIQVPDFRSFVQPIARPRPETPSARMMLEQHRSSSSFHHHSLRSHPYERPEPPNRAALEDRIRPATPHPRAKEKRKNAAHARTAENKIRATTPHPRVEGRSNAPTTNSRTLENLIAFRHQGAGSSTGNGNRSAFTAPHDQTQRSSNVMPPPPPLMPSMPANTSGPIAPRTPFQPFHNPFFYPYPAFGSSAPSPAQAIHTLEGWFRAGLPPPHLLSPSELQIYYHLFIDTMLTQVALGYHQHHQQQQHEQLYRNYPLMAMTPGDAYYPPPQYGFAKPIAVTPSNSNGPSAVAASTAAASVDPPAKAASPSIGLPQQHGSAATVPTSEAGYLPTTLPSVDLNQQQQSQPKQQQHLNSSHGSYPNSQSEPARPLTLDRITTTPAVGFSAPERSTSAALMPPPSMIFSSSKTHSPTSSTSSLRSPSRMGPPPLMQPWSNPLPTSSMAPPGRNSSFTNMSSSSCILSPGSMPPPRDCSHTSITSQSTMLSSNSTSPPIYHASVNVSSSTTTSVSSAGQMATSSNYPLTYIASQATKMSSNSTPPPIYYASVSVSSSTTTTTVSSAERTPPPSNHPLYGGSLLHSTITQPKSMPPPSNYNFSTSYASSTTGAGLASSGASPPASNHATSNIFLQTPIRHTLMSPDSMPSVSNRSSISTHSPSSISSTVHSSGNQRANASSPSTTMPPPSFVLSTGNMPILSHHLTSNRDSQASPAMASPNSMSPPDSHASASMHSPSVTSTMLSPGRMPPPSNPLFKMPSPTSTNSSISTMTSPPPGSMTRDHTATFSPPLPDRVPLPNKNLPSSMATVYPSTTTAMSSTSETPSKANSHPITTSSATLLPSNAICIIHNMPSPPTTSAQSSAPSPPSTITLTAASSSSSTGSPPSLKVQPYTHNSTPASMPSLEVLLNTPSIPPATKPTTRSRASARRKSCSEQSAPSYTVSEFLSPAAETKKRGRANKGSRKTPATNGSAEPAQHMPKRRGRSASVAASHSPFFSELSLPPLPPTPKPPPIDSPSDSTLDTSNVGPLLAHVRREMVAFLQHRRANIITTMRIYTIGRMDFDEFLAAMRRHSVTFRDFMHVAFTVMRRCGHQRFAKEPPDEPDYKWPNPPPQEFATYFSNIRPCTDQFVSDNFDFLKLVVDNLLQQYFDPMEHFLLTYVLGVEPKKSN